MASIGRLIRGVIATGSVAFIVVAGSTAVAQVDQTWSALQGGPPHLGASPEGTPEAPYRIAWRTAASGPQASGLGPAVISGGIGIAEGPSALIAFDPATGAERWRVARAGGVLNAPAVDPTVGDGGVVVFTQGTTATTSGVVGIDLATHQQLWRFQESARGQPHGPFRAAPSISGGIVYVGSQDGFVVALDAASGTLKWKLQTGGQVLASPAVGGGRVFVISEDTTNGRATLYALNASTGARAWTFSPSVVAIHVSAPTVAPGTVYAGFGDGSVKALDASSGKVRWTAPVRGVFSPYGGLALAGETLFAEDATGGVYAFATADGERKWDFAFPFTSVRGAPLVVGDQVLVGYDSGSLEAIDIRTGNLVWRTHLRTGGIGALAPSGALVLAPSLGSRGGIVAFEHDPSGRRLNIESPTKLHVGRALLNFGASFVLVVAGVLGLFRLALRRRPAPTEPWGDGSEGWSEADADEATMTDGNAAAGDGDG